MVPQVPASLDEALAALEADHDFLHGRRRVHRRPHRDLRRLQATNEIDAIRLRPHPYEFHLYYDI